MTMLLNKLTEANVARWGECQRNYRALIRRADAPLDGDEELLRDAMALMAITPREFQMDVYAIAEEQRLTGLIRTREQLDEAKAASEAEKNRIAGEVRAAIRESIDKLDLHRLLAGFGAMCSNSDQSQIHQDWCNRTVDASTQWQEINNESRNTEASLRDLKSSNPRIWGE